MKKILIIDIETTGFSHSKNHIVEIGMVSLDLDTGERKIIYDSVIREDGITKEEIEKSWIVENSDLTTEEIMNSRCLEFYKDEIQKIIHSYSLGATAYNNIFDFGFLESRDIIIENKLRCPMKLSTNICKLPGKYGFKWPTVEEAYHYFFPDVEYIEKHRGADDAMHEAEIVCELYKLGIFKL